MIAPASLRVDFETQVLPGSYSVFPYSTYDGLVYLGGVEQSLAETVAGYTGLRDGLNGWPSVIVLFKLCNIDLEIS